MFELIKSLIEEKDNSESENGTFVGVRLSSDSKKIVKKAIKDMDVPNPIEDSEMHITVIYSRKPMSGFEPKGKLDDPIIVKPDKLHIFQKSDSDNRVLVIKLKAPELKKRHNELMKEYKAEYDFDEYIPHLTLSYDCEDFDPKSYDIKKILSEDELEIVEEYDEELDLNWK